MREGGRQEMVREKAGDGREREPEMRDDQVVPST